MYWKIFTDANTPDKARKVLGWVIDKLSVQYTGSNIEPYPKGRFVCAFEVASSKSSWAEVVVESLALAQKVGRGWELNGNIEEEIDAWSNDSSVNGVKNIHLMVENA